MGSPENLSRFKLKCITNRKQVKQNKEKLFCIYLLMYLSDFDNSLILELVLI